MSKSKNRLAQMTGRLSVQQLFEYACEYHRAARLTDAIDLYQAILQAGNDLPEVHSNLAAALQAQGKLTAAVASYQDAIRLAPQVAALHSNLGTVLQDMGRVQDAIASYRKALLLDGKDADTLCNLAAACESIGELDEALRNCHAAIVCDPGNARAHNNMGNVLRKQGDLVGALASYGKALSIRPDYALASENMAAAHLENKLLREISSLRQESQVNPQNAGIYNDLGNALKSCGNLSAAMDAYQSALCVDPQLVEAHSNLGAAYAEKGEFMLAVECYQRALQINPHLFEALSNLGVAYLRLDDPERALTYFQRAVRHRPDVPEYYANLGAALVGLERIDEAIAAQRRAIAMSPGRADFHRNLASSLLFQNRYKEAIASYEQALSIEPHFPDALRNLGSVLGMINRREEAVANYRKALRYDPGNFDATSMLAHHLQHLCDWEEWTVIQERVLSATSLISTQVSQLGLLSLESTPLQQFTAACACFKSYVSNNTYVYRNWKHKDQLRIGYLSSDFREHPVSYLLGEVFELHDRARVEVYAYSGFGKDDRSEARRRIRDAAHHFVDVERLSSKAAARRIHEDGIDILIDLGGHTQHARTGVMALRPAPVQVNYLGYPGTMGAPFIDYIITDRFVTPLDAQPHFSEKFVYMPHCFQPNDRKKAIAGNIPGRKACGLPEEGFVFCSFNKSYKLTPRVFDVWMRLLQAVPGSVLWLSDGSPVMMDNLRREARQRGVEPARLIFASRVDAMAEHLGRQRHADLFLDTLPYNAHTTASDALWAGLPVLTCAGETFASRVAGSLLHAIGLPELVTTSLAEYEALALRLAGDLALLASFRQRLLANRLTTPLFDSATFVKDLERAYELMWENHRQGNPPQLIEVRA